jgi:integrase/recombinase XerD
MVVYRYTEAELSRPDFRQCITAKDDPYYIVIARGRVFGYRRNAQMGGRWVARIRVSTGYGYREATLGVADDDRHADGHKILDFKQARMKALLWFESPEFLPIRTEAQEYHRTSQLIVCPIGDRYTVAHAMHDFCVWKKEVSSDKAWRAATSRANTYIIPLLGGVPCENLTVQQCRSLLIHIEGSAVRRRGGTSLTMVDPETLDPEIRRKRRITANNTYTEFRTALNIAYSEGKIASNNSWRRVRIFRTVYRARPDILTWEQARRLVEIASPELKSLILAGLYTGCRVTELYRLRVGDVDRTRAALYIQPGKNFRGRTIALPEEGYEFFKALAEGQPTDAKLIKRRQNWPWTHSYVSKHFKKLTRQLGLPSSFVFHCLRHTYASLLLRANTPPVVVARQLGHLNAETTLRTYAHVTDDFMDHEFRRRFKPALLSQPDLFAKEILNTMSIPTPSAAPPQPRPRQPQFQRKVGDPPLGTKLCQLRSLRSEASLQSYESGNSKGGSSR